MCGVQLGCAFASPPDGKRALPQALLYSFLLTFVSTFFSARQTHPFCEGNTRTTGIFTIKYLRMLGYDMNNDLFANHSWYFRNALVRANYRNVAKGIDLEPIFMIRFFRNLLLGENNTLKNRYMLINPPEEWRMPEQVPEQAPEQVPEQVPEQAPEQVTRQATRQAQH